MVKLYVDLILSGELDISQVPLRWRESVANEIKKLGA